MKNKVDAKRLQELTGGKLRNPMSVETMDPHDEGLKISTGISVLDRFLWGGLPMGTLTVIAESNITGNDQIHLKDQIACEAINSGHNVFYFVDLDANINLTGERLRNYIKSDSNLKENLGEIFGQSLLETKKTLIHLQNNCMN